MKTIRIGCGAGYAGDRIEPALEIIEHGHVDYIAFECLAERTIAIAQQEKLANPDKGYNSLLEYRMKKALPLCMKNGVTLITNMGAANPEAAMKVTKKIAEDLQLKNVKIAAVLGDDIFGKIDNYNDYEVLETGDKLNNLKGTIVSANVYLGVDGILKALANGANIIITGRVADPSLFLAPMMYEFGWTHDNHNLIGRGISIGHLLECAAQVTGGYFADPGYKDIPNLWKIGFPIAEMSENGTAIITKVDSTGGLVSAQTCKEQLLYEIHDPANYVTPDGIADFTTIRIEEPVSTKNKVVILNAQGKKRPDTLKVSIGYKNCFIGEGKISYGGPGAYERASLAGEIVKQRLKYLNTDIEELRVDLIGVNSLYKDSISKHIMNQDYKPPEVRLRVAGRTLTKIDATTIANEVEALYTNGPAAGGGVTKSVQEIVSIASIFIPRENIDINVLYEEVF